MAILDIHEFMPHTTAPAGYLLHEWTCTCGARSPQRWRSRVLAEIGWFEHAFPLAPAPPAHRITIVPGPYENSLAWECSCGETDRRGRADERRTVQSHTAHVNHETVRWWRSLYEEAYAAMTFDERRAYDADRLRARWAWEDEQKRRPLHPEVAKALLDKLI